MTLNPPAAIATPTAMPITPTSARPGYLISIRTPSLTSSHHESSDRYDRAPRRLSFTCLPDPTSGCIILFTRETAGLLHDAWKFPRIRAPRRPLRAEKLV